MSAFDVWSRCVSHLSTEEAEQFTSDFFSSDLRQALLIAGAGFDPRSATVARLLSRVMGKRLHGYFIREERRNPPPRLINMANANEDRVRSLIHDHTVVHVRVFADDDAVTGARSLVRMINELDFRPHTDVIVDCSSLSIGLSFPVIRFLFERAKSAAFNLHLMVSHAPQTDSLIEVVPCESPSPIHGFRGELDLSSREGYALLWLPQLALGRRSMLEKIHSKIRPHDVCPILPFPAADLRAGDTLLEYFQDDLESAWGVDARSLVYADESNPLDLFRTISRLHSTRMSIFASLGGSMMVLSPSGDKALAMGSLMAALAYDCPVWYVEASGYEIDIDQLAAHHESELMHIWLFGEAYSGTELSWS